MTKTPIDYSKTIIYKICCKDINIKDVYVGSTTNFRSRKNQHKTCCNNPNNKRYNLYVYQFIRDNGGWDNWQIIMIKKYTKCESKQQCLKKERKYIEKLNTTLNRNIPGRTQKEYQESKREYYIQYFKQYHQKNKVEQQIKKSIAINCECGSIVTKTHIARHRKSKKHLKLLQQQNQ